MDPATRFAGHTASARVRAAWVSAHAKGPGPELAPLLADLPPAAAIEAVIADAELRWDRGWPAGVEHYAEALPPALAADPALRRALLMCELARRDAEPVASLRDELLRRFPDRAGDIDSVLAITAIMRSARDDAALNPPPPAPAAGQALGKYTLIHQLGAGTFGEVWKARDTELDRYVALKLLHGGADGGGAERLIAEARAAAALDHENIVAVHAAGTLETADGPRLYIDAQLVGDPSPTARDPINVAVGGPLDDPDRPRPSPRRAAEIVEAVARAVAAAHARGVVHRDLKPANILIAPSGRPMVADFGLSSPTETAEAAAGRAASSSDARGQVVGTPAYMAPEQARGEPATPLADVFALGGILRFLLTGAPPFSPSGRFSPDARADVLAQASAGEIGPLRATDGAPLPRTLAAIAARATAARPADRYISAEQFAADLRAYLEHRPTLADRPSALRKAAMAYRRHAPIATVAAAAIAVMTIGTVRFIDRLQDERDRAVAAEDLANRRRIEAEHARDAAAAANRFIAETLGAVNPSNPRAARDPKISEMLAVAARRAAALSDQPHVEAHVRATVGDLYLALSRPRDAEPHINRALELRTSLLGPEHPDTLHARRLHAQLAYNLGRPRDAIAELTALAELDARVLGPDHRETLVVLNTLGSLHAGEADGARAEHYQRLVYEGRARTLGPEHLDTLGARRAIASALTLQRKHDEAAAILRELCDRFAADEKLADTFIAAITIHDLGAVLREAGRHDEAEPLLRDALERYRATVGPEHAATLNAELNLGGLLLHARNRPDEALPLLQHATDTLARTTSADARLTISGRKVLGRCLLRLGRPDDAFAVFSLAHESAVRAYGPTHAETLELAAALESCAVTPGRPAPPR